MSSEWNQIKLRGAITANIYVLRFAGCWWPESKNKNIRRLYTIYSFFYIFNMLLYVLTEFIYALSVINDLEKFTSGCFLFLTHVVQLAKTYKFSICHESVGRFVKDMENELFVPRYPEQVSMMRKSTEDMKKIYRTFMFLGVATCTLWAVFPFLDDDKIRLPLTGWYPFDTNGYTTFRIVFFYQILHATLGAIQNITFDCTISSFMRSICDQLDLLNDSLEHMRQRCESRNDDVQKEMDDELERCIRHHKFILRMTKKIKDLFSLILLFQFGITIFIMCVSLFKLSVIEFGTAQFISLVTYQGCILTETFLFCWFGNEITLKSSHLSLSAFHANWIDCSQKFKKNLLFLMIRTKVPIRLYAGGFVTLSVETFTAIVRTSYSYFAVLHRVHDK